MRGALHGPGFRQVDFVVHKRFRISEDSNVEFRAEFFNIFNLTNFANPPVTLPNALGTGTNQIQPGQPYTAAAAGSFRHDEPDGRTHRRPGHEPADPVRAPL